MELIVYDALGRYMYTIRYGESHEINWVCSVDCTDGGCKQSFSS